MLHKNINCRPVVNSNGRNDRHSWRAFIDNAANRNEPMDPNQKKKKNQNVTMESYQNKPDSVERRRRPSAILLLKRWYVWSRNNRFDSLTYIFAADKIISVYIHSYFFGGGL